MLQNFVWLGFRPLHSSKENQLRTGHHVISRNTHRSHWHWESLLDTSCSLSTEQEYAHLLCTPKNKHHSEWKQYKTRSTETVHTSAKARLSWLSVVGRWYNDIIVAMAMPASACPALQHCMVQWDDNVFRISQQWRIWKTIPVSRQWTGLPPKFNHWFTGPLPNLPREFHANPFLSFCAKLLTDRQTNRQTHKQWRKHNLLGGDN